MTRICIVICLRLNRGGSGGFVLTEDSLDEDFLKNSLQQEQEWISKFRSRKNPGLIRRDTNDSSKYSFSTEYRYLQYKKINKLKL